MISVVIPVYNARAYIAQTIDSVLGQTLPPDEIVVVDDGSTDGTDEVLRGYEGRIRNIRQSNQGPGAARSRGLDEARGDMLALLDADDLWLPDKLRLQAAAFQEQPGLEVVFCYMDQFISPEIPKEVARTLVCDGTPRPAPVTSCLLARRSVFERVGGLRSDTKCDFIDWYLRAQEAQVRACTLDQLLVRRRIHTSNFSLRNKDIRTEYLRLLKASLDRRRAAQS